MNLFLKIFLWFLAAIGLMIGVVVFLNWTIQTEPVVSRWQISIRNQMKIYAETAGQIMQSEGEAGLRTFTRRLREGTTITEIDIVRGDGSIVFADVADVSSYKDLIEQTMKSGQVELELNAPDSALAAKSFELQPGVPHILIVRWSRPQPVPVFGESRLRYLRLTGLFLTALVLCYALALYLSSPIGKIRRATQRLAAGDLTTRVAGEVGRRHDELAKLASDFDLMAERIENLVTSQKRLTRDVSHELRSPLARMNVALEIAKQKATPESAPILERIETESARLNEMIGKILTLSKLESGSREFERTEIGLGKLVERIASDADFEAQAKNKSVKVIRSDDCKVNGNEGLLQSAIENVLRNAVRYTADGTEVDVSVERKGSKAVVMIRDRGAGVPEDELANLFTPFYRVGEARERRTGGIGLGLAIAEQAIRAHNGSIDARNTGEGLEVTITLECSSAGQGEDD
jgi:two-component system sensor histidine kinase CpxA